MWHNRISVASWLFRRFCPKRPAAVLTSPSKDGELVAGLVSRFGPTGAVRGSSSRRGATAMREMVATIESGTDIIITPDGPRGPVYQFGPGALKLAQLTGAPLVPFCIQYEKYWELRSWDRFQIPKPFSRVNVTIGPILGYRQAPAGVKHGPEEAEAWFIGEKARLEAAAAEALHEAGRF